MYTRKNNHIFLLSTAFLLFLTNCSKDTIANSPTNTETPYAIGGKIENWVFGDTMSIKAIGYENMYGRGDSIYVFGSAKVKNDGSFFVDLFTPPKILHRGYANGAYTFSDPDAKFYAILGLALFHSDSIVYKLAYNASNPYDQLFNIGEYNIYFEYADRNVTMTGTDYGGNSYGNMITEHHIVYKKGWNRIKTQLISIINKDYHFKREVSDTLGGKWIIEK